MDKKVKGEIIKSGNIVLSGFMGSGKTTVGRRLAAALDMQFVDMDLYIEKKTGMTVKEIFAEYGELHFRALETETVKELAQSNHFVIATGGGMVLDPENRRFMRAQGTVFYLAAPAEALARRLARDPLAEQRPSLTGLGIAEEMQLVLDERRPLYEDADHHILDATAEPAIVCVEALRLLGRN